MKFVSELRGTNASLKENKYYSFLITRSVFLWFTVVSITRGRFDTTEGRKSKLETEYSQTASTAIFVDIIMRVDVGVRKRIFFSCRDIEIL